MKKLICIALCLVIVLSFCSCGFTVMLSPKVYESPGADALTVGCECAFTGDELFYWSAGFYSPKIYKTDGKGSRKCIASEYKFNCSIGYMQSVGETLYFTGTDDDNIYFFSYDTNSKKTQSLGSVQGWERGFCVYNGKFYYLKYLKGSESDEYDFCCYDCETNTETTISEHAVKLHVDNGSLLWVEKSGFDLTVYKLKDNADKEKLYTYTYARGDYLSIRISESAMFITGSGYGSKLILFDTGKEYTYPVCIHDAVISEDSVYYITYYTKETDGGSSYEYGNLYVRKFSELDATLIKEKIGTSSFDGTLPGGGALLRQSKDLTPAYTELYSVYGTDMKSLAKY